MENKLWEVYSFDVTIEEFQPRRFLVSASCLVACEKGLKRKSRNL